MIDLCSVAGFVPSNYFQDQYSGYFSCNSYRPYTIQDNSSDKLKKIQEEMEKLNKEPDIVIKSDYSTRVNNINWSSLGPSWV